MISGLEKWLLLSLISGILKVLIPCFKKVCLIERNTNENYRKNNNISSSTASNNKKALSSNHLVSDLDEEVSVQKQLGMVVKTRNTTSRPNWNPPTKLKFRVLWSTMTTRSRNAENSLIWVLGKGGKSWKRTGCVSLVQDLGRFSKPKFVWILARFLIVDHKSP